MDPRTFCTADQRVSPPHPSTSQDEKIPNQLVQLWRSGYQRLGFQKGYNFSFFIVFAGAIVGFSLARLSYLNISGSASSSYANGASPGEWYWYSHGIHRIGITIHLATILPAGLLMVWQFIPLIRRKFLMAHRINGYLVVTLVIISNIGALIIARRAFGDSLSTQAGVGVLVIISTVSIALAYYNIKRLQIDQHRAWMLRAVFHLGTIVTLRLIMILSALISSKTSNYNTTMTCGELLSILDTSGGKRADYIRIQGVDGSMDLWTNEVGNNPANWIEQDSVASGVGFSGPSVQFVSFAGSGRADYIPVIPGSGAIGPWLNGCTSPVLSSSGRGGAGSDPGGKDSGNGIGQGGGEEGGGGEAGVGDEGGTPAGGVDQAEGGSGIRAGSVAGGTGDGRDSGGN
ncbi:MAG: hypothetical protein Q9199_004491 [Rusavskia elegans]